MRIFSAVAVMLHRPPPGCLHHSRPDLPLRPRAGNGLADISRLGVETRSATRLGDGSIEIPDVSDANQIYSWSFNRLRMPSDSLSMISPARVVR